MLKYNYFMSKISQGNEITISALAMIHWRNKYTWEKSTLLKI